MSASNLTIVFFVYGLAFFTMGLVVALEGGRASDRRLRHALRPLAVFGLLHGLHEWMEMFERLGLTSAGPGQALWQGLRLAMLSFSFLSLTAFGASLLAPTEAARRLSLSIPVVLVTLWGLGLLALRPSLSLGSGLWEAAHAWTRYILALPAALLAAAGLIAQQRAFRRAGLTTFSRDSLWAAVAFAWYGLVGQMFAEASGLPPSTVLNEALFLRVFGFPVQIMRALAASAASVFIIRFLRAFEVEAQHHIAGLQAARLQEAERREAQRGELLRRVVAAQEAERQRVARELHDVTGQSLTALGLGLRGVATTLQGDAPALPAAALKLRQLETLVSGALDELRGLIADLRPSHLDDLGLAAALRWYGKDVQQRRGLAVHVEIEGEPRQVSGPVRTALFRMAQEALTNVLKHSGAADAWVRLAFAPEGLRLEVEDNGRGLAAAPPGERSAGRPAWGLLGMRERAELLGGCFEIGARPGGGTRVVVTIPAAAEAVA
ncbi:MAG: sensor histidine kinase [Anaerolineales bacterium]|nr:sensor histidine kinase [Anaerolineales bacterium]